MKTKHAKGEPRSFCGHGIDIDSACVDCLKRPLFMPLKAKYFDAFADGSKDTEYRVLGPRWNVTTCRIGRRVILSRGYGKQRRLAGIIEGFKVDSEPMRMKEWCEVYGDDPTRHAACIKIRLVSQLSGEL